MYTPSVGSIFRFGSYKYQLPGVPGVFSPEHAVVVIEVEADGVFRAARADLDGFPIMEITDTLFVEELHPHMDPVVVL